MQNLLAAIRQSIAQGNWYAALYLALTMPDICSKLQDPSSNSSGKRYRMWFDQYMKHMYRSDFHGAGFHFLTAGDCWALRCSLLHEGIDEISHQKSREVLARFAFTTQNFHRGKMGNVLVLNVAMFCSEVITGVEDWLTAVSGNQSVQERLLGMAEIQTMGFSPTPGVWISDDLAEP